jgi:hypothetical protein
MIASSLSGLIVVGILTAIPGARYFKGLNVAFIDGTQEKYPGKEYFLNARRELLGYRG